MSQSTFSRFRIPAVVCALCLAATLVLAQSTTDGAISGTIYDPSGAVVANATVTVLNNSTGAAQATASDKSGNYHVGKLAPSTYTVDITAAGFAPYRGERVIVQVGTTTELSPRLTLGNTTQTVDVSAELPQVNTTSADFAPVVNQVAISNLPINGGRWSDFVLLTPGVVNDSNGFGLVSFRGISTLLNNNTIDGADNNQAFFSEERGRTRAGYSSAKVAVQEFQVNTSNYSAEYGRAAGAVVNTVTKSGGNQFHGEAYFYDRDNDWGAKNPFTTFTTQTSPGVFTTSVIKPKDWRKMYGFGVGGPIIKNKLFFYVADDQYTRNFPGVAVPSNLSTFYAPPSASTVSTLATRLGVSTAVATTDYNNALAALASDTGFVPRTGSQNILFPKLDWQINDKHHLSLEANRMRWASPAGIQTQATVGYAADSFGNDYVKDTWGVAKLNSLLTNALSNEIRFQYGRDFEFETPQSQTPYEQATLLASPNFPGYSNPLGLPPFVQITGATALNLGTPNFLIRPNFPDERRTQFADTVSWLHGNHMIKFGGDFNHVNDNIGNLFQEFGQFNYSSLLNYFSDVLKPNSCGGPCYSGYSQAFGPLGLAFSTNDYAFFAQDDWRVLPRLTLSLGLRWEYEQLPSPVSNLVNPAVPQTGAFPTDKNNFGPRIGFAWDIFGDGKTSLRGGYGIYYGRMINSQLYNALLNTGVSAGQVTYNFNASTAGAPMFPQVLSAPPTGASGSRPSVVMLDPRFQNPQIHQVDLSFEREVGWNTVISFAYLGSYGHELPNFTDSNIAPSTRNLTYSVVGGGPLTTPTYTTPLFTVRPNPAYGQITDIFSGTSSNYNALVLQANHRMNRHVQFSANFTWSHALDYGENVQTGNTPNLLLPTNVQLEYGNSLLNVPKRFVLSMVAESPWKLQGWLGTLANGWQLSPIVQWQNGLPFSAQTSGSPPSGLNAVLSGINGSGGRFGIDVLGRNSYMMPNTEDVDLKLAKQFSYRERYTLELSGQAFNLMNHYNVTGVNTTAYTIGGTAAAPTLSYNKNFGVPTSANSNFAYTPRQVQLAIRLMF